MVISVFFSLLVYRGLVSELQRSLHVQALRYVPRIDRSGEVLGYDGSIQAPYTRRLPPTGVLLLDPAVFEDAKRRVALQLFYINLGILGFSGMAGYFLAGRTLNPIEAMLDEQKRFIADASHELRTPLTAMKTEIEVALRDKGLDAEYARELLRSNLEEVDKLKMLSDDLLSLGSYQKENGKLRNN